MYVQRKCLCYWVSFVSFFVFLPVNYSPSARDTGLVVDPILLFLCVYLIASTCFLPHLSSLCLLCRTLIPVSILYYSSFNPSIYLLCYTGVQMRSWYINMLHFLFQKSYKAWCAFRPTLIMFCLLLLFVSSYFIKTQCFYSENITQLHKCFVEAP